MRGLAWLLLACFLAPLASAGSAEDPEMDDPANDQELFGLVPISQQPPALTSVGLNSDILAAWVEDQGETLLFTIRLQGTGAPTVSSTSHYAFHFSIAGAEYVATAAVAPAAPVGDGGVTPGGVATQATSGSSLVTMTVPKAAIGSPPGGTTLTGLYSTAEGVLLDAAEDFTSDRAPDDGFGRDFVLPGPDVPATQYIEATLPLSNSTAEPTTAVLQYNWTGSAPLRVQASVEAGNLSLELTILDEIVLSWNGTSLDEVLDERVCFDAAVEPAACTYALRVEMQDFVGAFEVSVAEGAASPGVDGNGTLDGAPGNGTTDGTLDEAPVDKGSPAPGVVWALAAAAALRRRR